MTSLYYVAKALLKLQTIVGIIPKIIGKGKCANVNIIYTYFYIYFEYSF